MTDSGKINHQINYQSGAVVSREIVSKPTGTITLFAFDQDQGLSQHTAPYEVLVIATDGRAEIRISDKSYNVTEGDMLKIPAGEPHSLKAVKPFKMVLIMIKSV